MFVNGSNVGIGTASPTSKLTIVGTGTDDTDIRLYDNDGT
ncbi:unnamed protein product, partial [marine sediment metagenome]